MALSVRIECSFHRDMDETNPLSHSLDDWQGSSKAFHW